MPRKKELVDERYPLPTDVQQLVSTDPVLGRPRGLMGLIRKFLWQFLCGGLLILLGVMTLLFLNVRNDSAAGVLPDAAGIAAGGLDTTSDEAVLQAVSELMILPDEPEPIIALVADAARLQAEQAFYRGAENGDMLLVFPQSRQAVIYRPSSNKIVNVGPLIVDDNE